MKKKRYKKWLEKEWQKMEDSCDPVDDFKEFVFDKLADLYSKIKPEESRILEIKMGTK